MMLAREAFAAAENDQLLRKALEQRIYTDLGDIQNGDWIYYKRNPDRSWRGPAKVVGVNGKKLFINQGVNMVMVNKDECVRRGEEFWKIDKI